CPRVRCTVPLDPATVMGGRPLAAGLWDLRLRVMFSGLTRTSALRPRVDDPADPPVWLSDGSAPRSVAAYWTKGSPSLALDVEEWMHPLADIVGNAPGDAAEVGSRRQLRVALPPTVGHAGSRRSARLVLIDNDGAHPPLPCKAVVHLAPDGASLHAKLPRLPSRSAHWSVWLALDEVGATPPRRLAVTVARGRFGRAVIVPAAEATSPS